MTKDAFWFSHDANARNDPRVIKLRRLHGYEGVGIFWGLIEILRDAEKYEIEISLLEDILYDARMDDKIVESLFEIGLLSRNDDIFWSASLKERMAIHDEKKRKRIENGKLGGRPKKNQEETNDKPLVNQRLSDDKPVVLQSVTTAKPMPNQCESSNITEHNIIEQKKEKKVSRTKKPYSEDFERFWDAYPKKKQKSSAFKAFEKAKNCGLPETEELCKIVLAHSRQLDWTKEKGQFVPYPATWLNNEQWDDEIDAPKPRQPPMVYGMND